MMDFTGMSAQQIGEEAGIPWKGFSKEALIKKVEKINAVKLPGKAFATDEHIKDTVDKTFQIETSEKPPMPEYKPDMAKLTPTQQEVAGYVQTAKKDAPKPKIEVIRENFNRIKMEIPKGVERGNEYEYAWLSIKDLASSIYPGSKWEIVTMSNHSHTPKRLFGNDGAITYEGQNILAYCYRYVQEAEQAEIISDFNKKTERMTETKEVVGESASRVDPQSTGKVFEQQVLNQEEEYDFQ